MDHVRWGASCPLIAKLPVGMRRVQTSQISRVLIYIDGCAQRPIGQNWKYLNIPSEIVGHKRVFASSVDAQISWTCALRTHGVQKSKLPIAPVDRKGTDRAISAFEIGNLIACVKVLSRRVERQPGVELSAASLTCDNSPVTESISNK